MELNICAVCSNNVMPTNMFCYKPCGVYDVYINLMCAILISLNYNVGPLTRILFTWEKEYTTENIITGASYYIQVF